MFLRDEDNSEQSSARVDCTLVYSPVNHSKIQKSAATLRKNLCIEILEHIVLVKDIFSVKQYFEKCGKLHFTKCWHRNEHLFEHHTVM